MQEVQVAVREKIGNFLVGTFFQKTYGEIFAATLAVVRDATTAQTRAYVALLSFRGKDTICGLAVACW